MTYSHHFASVQQLKHVRRRVKLPYLLNHFVQTIGISDLDVEVKVAVVVRVERGVTTATFTPESRGEVKVTLIVRGAQCSQKPEP